MGILAALEYLNIVGVAGGVVALVALGITSGTRAALSAQKENISALQTANENLNARVDSCEAEKQEMKGKMEVLQSSLVTDLVEAATTAASKGVKQALDERP